MPTHLLNPTAIVSILEGEFLLGNVLLYPEVSSCEKKLDRLQRDLRRGIEGVRSDLPRLELSRRHASGAPDLCQVTIELDPPDRSETWRTPVRLTFHTACWDHGTAATIAYIPALGIEVIVPCRDELLPRIERHIRFALMRLKATTSLERLLPYAQVKSVELHPLPTEVEYLSPRERAKIDQDTPKESVLKQVGDHLGRMTLDTAFGMEETVMRLAEWLVGKRPKSVLLIGPSGVGKTAAVHEMVRQRRTLEMGQTPFWATSGARIVAGMSGFGMWQERCQSLCSEAAQTNAIVHLGNLVELAEVGQYEGNDQGVGHFLRPFIERGDLLTIAECTPEQCDMLETNAPNLLDAFVRLEVVQPEPDASLSILRQAAERRSRFTRTQFSDEALDTLERLHRHYATYSASPGRPLRFLYNMLDDAIPDTKLLPTDVTQAFARETGLPQFLLDDETRLDLDETEKWFQRRVLGQARAVNVLVDLMATVKAGLSRPDRPIASLLFIGPTGVGKTEMAKCLAEFLYHDRHRMTRIDMTEFADSLSVDRLLGGIGQSEGILTSKVREQPFGVVLFDEFEKAHPRFFDLLLQVLGEGRLTDASGRLADFRNAVIIMTSNLGTESFARESLGFGPSRNASSQIEQAEEHFVREVQTFMRPEMFNRIDRIVPFLPLDRKTLHQIARRELDLLDAREGIRYHDLTLEMSDAVVDEIVRVGYDPRYGARPIKRAVDRHVLAPLANALNDTSTDMPLRARIALDDSGISASVSGMTRGTQRSSSGSPLRQSDPRIKWAKAVTEFRRDAEHFNNGFRMLDVRNQIFRLQRLAKRLAKKSKGQHQPFTPSDRLKELRPLQILSDATEQLTARAVALEERLLLDCYGNETSELKSIAPELDAGQAELQRQKVEMFLNQFDKPRFISLVLFSEQSVPLFRLARAYHKMAMRWKFQINVFALLRVEGSKVKTPTADLFPLKMKETSAETKRRRDTEPKIEAHRIKNPADYLAFPQDEPLGIGFQMSGDRTMPLFGPESGMHVFAGSKKKQRCLVDTSVSPLKEYSPPERISRRGTIGSQPLRRTYHMISARIEDPHTDSSQRWIDDDISELLGRLIESYFMERVDTWVE